MDTATAKKVKRLLDKFNFQLVRNAMLLAGWTYEDKRTLTLQKLRKVAEDCLISLLNRKECIHFSTGGFVAEKEIVEGTDYEIKLTFELETQYLL